MMKTPDARLRDDVLAELAWDARLDPRAVAVNARGGLITLTGYVTSYAEKLAAADAAHRVAGVFDVANDIEVRLPDDSKRSDPEIAEAVRRTLEWDVAVPHGNITTTVTDGVVALAGELATAEQRSAAVRAIRNLIGVKAVLDNMHVAAEQYQRSQLEQAIRAAFLRHAQRDAGHIHVDIVGDTAMLSGDVHSWAERQIVVGAARGTVGVRNVIDRLHIDPYKH
jgi:osmotically-inducible protein OsmY